MYTLLRRGCPVPACKRCRRFFDDVRGHAIGCKLGPTGVAQKEHGFRQAAQQEVTKCARAWPCAPGDAPLLIDEIYGKEVFVDTRGWSRYSIDRPARSSRFEGYRYKDTHYVVWKWHNDIGWRVGRIINPGINVNSELGVGYSSLIAAQTFVETF